MCLYRLPDMVAALARDSVACPADPPADHRPDVDDVTPPPTEKHLVSTAPG
jgi:hypothetical protein